MPTLSPLSAIPPAAATLLKTLEAHPDRLKDNWCVPRHIGQLLHILALSIGAQTMLELGTSIGYSTLWLASAAQQTDGHIHTVDYYPERQQQAQAHLQQAGLDHRVTYWQGNALSTLDTLHSQQTNQSLPLFDLVFIDAAKKEYWAYAQQLAPMIRSGGYLLADNTVSHQDQMKDFLEGMAAWDGQTFFSTNIDGTEPLNGLLIALKC